MPGSTLGTGDAARSPVISVVIPTLNEADELAGAVESAGAGSREIVVSDSGSGDATLAVARRLSSVGGVAPRLRILEAPDTGLSHRAAACNRGAAAARGDVLLFLDADARLPDGWADDVAAALADPAVVGGAFHLHLGGDEPALRWVERVNRWRYGRSRLFYGDQGVFVRAATFRAAGGFPEVPVLESAALCRRLKSMGGLALVPRAVTASPRRFRDGGIGRVFWTDVGLWLRGLLRLGPGRAGRTY